MQVFIESYRYGVEGVVRVERVVCEGNEKGLSCFCMRKGLLNAAE